MYSNMNWPLVLVVVIVLMCVVSTIPCEGFTPLVYSGWRDSELADRAAHSWRYGNRMNPVDNEVARIASGAINCGTGSRDFSHSGTGSRDFSRGCVGLPSVGGPSEPVYLSTQLHSYEHMCGGKDAMCQCAGNETK